MKSCSDVAEGRLSHARVLKAQFSAFASPSAPLSDTELKLLSDLADSARYHPPYRDLYAAGLPLPSPRIIVAGWACQYRLLSDGQRQIISVRLPGDLTGPLNPRRLPASCAVAALTELETVSAQPLAEDAFAVSPAHPGLAHAVHVMTHLDNVLLHDHVVRLGRQTACSRFAHLMLGFYERLGRVGLAKDNRFAMPLTQDVLADVLGFSVVHVNRTIQQLRRGRLLDVRGGIVTLLQHEQLQALTGWVASSWHNHSFDTPRHEVPRAERLESLRTRSMGAWAG